MPNYEIELTRPFNQIPEIIQLEAKTGTELAEKAYKLVQEVKSGILMAANPKTRQDWKAVQAACSWVLVSFGPSK